MSQIPIVTALSDVYRLPRLQQTRWSNLIAQFKTRFGTDPEFVIRCPGRVNIIGEHIDYSLYEVLPMAITDDVIIAVATKPDTDSNRNTNQTISLDNVLPSRFPPRSIQLTTLGDVELDPTVLEWSNYFKAGFRGALEFVRQNHSDKTRFSGNICALVDGTVPPGAGLSSSAAFVCASALAVLCVNGITEIEKTSFVETAIVAERSIGVSSGGMDQAASILSESGSALYVAFHPHLTATPISFPPTKTEYAFLIAQTFVTADKHTTGPINYNLRVVECTMAAHILFKLIGLKGSLRKDKSPQGSSLRGFEDAYLQQIEDIEDTSNRSIDEAIPQLHQMAELASRYLVQAEGYTREDVASILSISLEDVETTFLRNYPVQCHRFKLRQRAIHVFNEAARVKEFYQLLSNNSQGGEAANDVLLESLGDIMNKGQDSCRDLYENSCPELDDLCQIARQAGSFGSRLTGAGFGGCTIHLVPKSRINHIKNAWKTEYYAKKWPEIKDQDLESWRGAVVVSEPEGGSSILRVDSNTDYLGLI